MKKILISLLAAAVLSGCSKNEGGAPPTSGVPVPDPSAPISLSAGIDATSESKAAVSGTAFPASTENVFRLTAYAGAAAPSTDWSTAYFADEQVDSGAESALSLKNAQYYPANGDKVYFYAYTPAATSLTVGTSSGGSRGQLHAHRAGGHHGRAGDHRHRQGRNRHAIAARAGLSRTS